MQSKVYRSLALAFSFGVIFYALLVTAWGYIPLFNPITNWLLDNFAGYQWISALIYFHDFILNIVLGFPLALLIHVLKPKRYLLYLAVALLPAFIWSNSAWINNPSFYEHWTSIVIGWATSLFSVPIALFIICWYNKHVPNKGINRIP
ncbi:hypothetical protein [Psychrobium sp. 1_MG-2023]|uniref:hypothetical protein n=1 Tax=Psychrobium sp. 1_MG-2023 TaxID=3062624 RepID=UPI000C32FCDE|nr:hypothetical protein [Psychrobium sp. 1_MG-2023]MDP2562342.1 hypothetical protein [Psychrobium sp. 1_MG-2023]PKF58048.1 hypothetical protein CW748_04405 [Alteromonadales bacterium alter-6D02]